MPWGPIDPKDHPDKSGSPLTPPFPDIAIASGRRAVPYLRKLKALSPQTLTLFLKDPRTDNNGADLVWLPSHDQRRGKNVLPTLTGPHFLSKQALTKARQEGPQAIHHLPAPRLALVLGGDTQSHPFGKKAANRLARFLEKNVPSHMSVMVTPSRRTPDHLLKAVARGLRTHQHWIWDETKDNPYRSILALADAIIVTADSHNMVSEALATAVPVYIFEPDSYPNKLKTTIQQLIKHPFVHLLPCPLETGQRVPIDSTELIVEEVRRLLDEGKN